MQLHGTREYDATAKMCLEAGVHERRWGSGGGAEIGIKGEVLSWVAAFRTPSLQARAWVEGHQMLSWCQIPGCCWAKAGKNKTPGLAS